LAISSLLGVGYHLVAGGQAGNGSLLVNGGSVTSVGGVVGGARERGNIVGTATVTSGTWANSGDLQVGYSRGRGTLIVNGGSVISSGAGYVGYGAGTGTATVTSGTWTNGGDLFVGLNGGGGTLIVNGGSVTTLNGVIGSGTSTASVGTATVTSGTWANSGDLQVGDVLSTGTLSMSGGLMSVAGRLSQGPFGTINLNAGGTLQIGVGGTTGVLDVSTLTNNGTLIFNRSDASTYSGILSGTGAVKQQGGGRLTLGGANSYSSVTTISGGTLALSGTGSIGTGGLNLGTTVSPGVFELAALASGTYTLPATGDLTGVGTLSGSGKTLAVLGSFLPGNSPGTITLGSGFTLDLSSSGTSVFQITSPLYTAGSFDLVNGTGSVIFGGVLSLDFSGGTYGNGTNVLQLFANTGGLSGTFSAVNFTGLGVDQSATFDSATGFITIIPEPSTYAMAFAGLACGGYSMWRRRKRA
jgi:hypothetical protein